MKDRTEYRNFQMGRHVQVILEALQSISNVFRKIEICFGRRGSSVWWSIFSDSEFLLVFCNYHSFSTLKSNWNFVSLKLLYSRTATKKNPEVHVYVQLTGHFLKKIILLRGITLLNTSTFLELVIDVADINLL